MKHIFTRAETLKGAALGFTKANKNRTTEAEHKLVEILNEQGFELVGEYKDKNTAVEIRCVNCGTINSLTPHHIKQKGTSCRECKRTERVRTLEKERETKRQAKASKKEAERKEHEKRLTAQHVCKICGGTYTIASYMQSVGTKYERDSGFCSATCRSKAVKINKAETKKRARASGKKYASKHYARAIQLGLPAEEGITLKKLITRDGLTCALCGLPCFYGGDSRADLYPSIDHIKPIHRGGGHTWDNVQVAHRICNSNKRDLIGEKWNNAPKGGAKQS